MGVLNRRNAVAGWAVWQLAKRVIRRKAKAKVAPVAKQAKKPKALVALLLAAGAGVATFLRLRGNEER